MGGTILSAQLLCFLLSALKEFLQGREDLPIAGWEEFPSKQKPCEKGVVAEDNIKSVE